MYAILIDNTFIINNRLCKADYRRMTSNPQLGLYGVKLTRNARSALLPKRVPRGWTQGTRGILLRTSERGPNGAPPDSPRADISLDTHDRDPKPPLRHCFRCPCSCAPPLLWHRSLATMSWTMSKRHGVLYRYLPTCPAAEGIRAVLSAVAGQ